MNHKFSATTVALHWLVGLCFIAVFAVGLYMVDLPKGPDKFELIGLHKSFGVLFLILAIGRLIWRLREGDLPAVAAHPAWQKQLAKAARVLLLLATILMPVSGVVMNIGGGRALAVFGVELVGQGDKIEWMSGLGHFLHVQSVNIIIVVFALHVAGALKHQFIDKDGTLARMFGR